MKNQPAVSARRLKVILVIVIFSLGLGVRMVDLTNPPFDFHPTRQLLNAVVARGMYYEMDTRADPALRAQAIALWKAQESYEPPILERAVAVAYLVTGGERLWISRLFTGLCWILGGIALFLLVLRLSSWTGALTSLVFYLFVPFGLTASRSFQVDPVMVMAILWAAWGLLRWGETPSLRWAVIAGILCGLALLIKVTSAYALIGLALAMVLGRLDLLKALRNRSGAAPPRGPLLRVIFLQTGIVMLLAGLPAALYYLVFLGRSSGGYFDFWTISFLGMLLKPSFYGELIKLVNGIIGLPALFGALIGVCLMRKEGRIFLLGIWAGYLVYMLSFPYQITTHEYYHLQLVPLVAISLAPWGEMVQNRLAATGGQFWRAIVIGILLLGCGYPVWLWTRTTQLTDYHGEAGGWARVGHQLPTDGSIIGLVHDYGYPLIYYGWRMVKPWPTQSDLELTQLRGGNSGTDIDAEFRQRTAGYSYFLVTLSGELDAQPQLKAYLAKHFQTKTLESGYALYDLRTGQ